MAFPSTLTKLAEELLIGNWPYIAVCAAKSIKMAILTLHQHSWVLEYSHGGYIIFAFIHSPLSLVLSLVEFHGFTTLP